VKGRVLRRSGGFQAPTSIGFLSEHFGSLPREEIKPGWSVDRQAFLGLVLARFRNATEDGGCAASVARARRRASRLGFPRQDE